MDCGGNQPHHDSGCRYMTEVHGDDNSDKPNAFAAWDRFFRNKYPEQVRAVEAHEIGWGDAVEEAFYAGWNASKDDDDMRPSYDFSGGVRGKHAATKQVCVVDENQDNTPEDVKPFSCDTDGIPCGS